MSAAVAVTRARASVIRESAIQAQIVALLRTLGHTVYVLGHPSPADGRRFRGTGQTPGVPDLLVFLRDPPRQLWIEVKGPRGRLRPAQTAFGAACRAASVAHLVGGYDAVVDWLITAGYARADQFPWYRREGA